MEQGYYFTLIFSHELNFNFSNIVGKKEEEREKQEEEGKGRASTYAPAYVIPTDKSRNPTKIESDRESERDSEKQRDGKRGRQRERETVGE